MRRRLKVSRRPRLWKPIEAKEERAYKIQAQIIRLVMILSFLAICLMIFVDQTPWWVGIAGTAERYGFIYMAVKLGKSTIYMTGHEVLFPLITSTSFALGIYTTIAYLINAVAAFRPSMRRLVTDMHLFGLLGFFALVILGNYVLNHAFNGAIPMSLIGGGIADFTQNMGDVVYRVYAPYQMYFTDRFFIFFSLEIINYVCSKHPWFE